MMVVVITILTMMAEVFYGLITGSMALLADGIHMGTHAFALIITVMAYFIADKHAHSPNFAFSTGKVGILGGFTSAVILGVTAFYMAYEAIGRLLNPEEIFLNQALLVAVIGLLINLISAFLLASGSHNHPHGHAHHHDHNLRAAYLHVVTDAMTSLLAIGALLTGKYLNVTWPDAAVAIIGSMVILKWAYGLLLSTGAILVDYYPVAEDRKAIDSIAKELGLVIRDIHIWKISGNSRAIIISGTSDQPLVRDSFAHRIQKVCHFDHLTLDIDCRQSPVLPHQS